jgi:hypothetical protein
LPSENEECTVSHLLQLNPAVAPQLRWLRQLSVWGPRRRVVALLVALAVAAAIGVPTDLVPTSLYGRMTPVVWWNYAIWALVAVLAGLVAATYVGGGDAAPGRAHGGGFAGGLASFFAVGCPICNKLVVAMLGAGGALSYFAPIQPVLGVFGIALLGASLVVRLRRLDACSASRAGRPREIGRWRR